MSQENGKDSKDVPKKDDRSKADLWVGRLLLIVGIIFIVTMFGFCTRLCSGGSDYDDRWDRLEHSVKTDPYYKQWD